MAEKKVEFAKSMKEEAERLIAEYETDYLPWYNSAAT